MTLENRLQEMADRGTSVSLTWGEDTALWECLWIKNGTRYTGFSKNLRESVHLCYELAQAKQAGVK